MNHRGWREPGLIGCLQEEAESVLSVAGECVVRFSGNRPGCLSITHRTATESGDVIQHTTVDVAAFRCASCPSAPALDADATVLCSRVAVGVVDARFLVRVEGDAHRRSYLTLPALLKDMEVLNHLYSEAGPQRTYSRLSATLSAFLTRCGV
jgi:hypothetical protein